MEEEGHGARPPFRPVIALERAPLHRLARLVSRRRAAEALAVLRRFDEGTPHLGAAHARLRLCVVAHVLAGLAEAVEFRQPEVVPAEIIIRRVVRVAAQVAVVLHEHEGRVVLGVEDRAALDHAPQRRRSARRVAGAVGRDGGASLGGRRRRARVGVELVNVGGSRLALRERRDVLGPGDEVGEIVLLVRLDLLLPVALPDDYALVNLVLVAQEDGVARRTLGVAEGGLVRADNEVAGLLELDGEEEGRRDIGARALAARRVRAARLDVVRPEVLPRLIRLTVEEVVVVLADEGRRVVYRVGRPFSPVVHDLERGRRGRAERAVLRVLEDERRALRPFSVVVVADEHLENLLRVARGEDEVADDDCVVALLLGRAVLAGDVHRGRLARQTRAQDGDGDGRDALLDGEGRRVELEGRGRGGGGGRRRGRRRRSRRRRGRGGGRRGGRGRATGPRREATADGELRAAVSPVEPAVRSRREGRAAQAGQHRAVDYRALGRELVELGRRDLDGNRALRRVQRAAVGCAALRVGERAVGVPNGCAVGERGRPRSVRRGLHVELVAAVADGEAVVARRTQAGSGRVGREAHAPVRVGGDGGGVETFNLRDDDGFARRAGLA